MKNAIVVAESIAVVCPYCGEAQPNPKDGSEQWLPIQLKQCAGVKKCCACDGKMVISWEPKAMIQDVVVDMKG